VEMEDVMKFKAPASVFKAFGEIIVNVSLLLKSDISFILCFLSVKSCPGNGSCSNRGKCSKTSGRCECNSGFHGEECQSINFSEILVCLSRKLQ